MSPPVPLPAVRRRLYLLGFIDEFAPLYALFTLWFVDNGLTIAQISITFVIWAALAVALELPSGALADRVDRRALIATAFALRAVGLAVWLMWPTFTGLLIGAVLWAIHDAAASGAWEALIHDQLDAVDHASSYGVVIARINQFTHVGLALGTVVASSLIGLGLGIADIGWVNVATHGIAIALVLLLPDVRWVAHGEHDATPHDTSDQHRVAAISRWWQTLRTGLADARHQPRLLRLIVIGALLAGLFIVDEYVPLLARLQGAQDAVVPLIVLTVWLGLLVGGEVAARRPDLSAATLGTGLLGGTAVMAVAIAVDSPWALLAIGVGYGTIEATIVIADARFQALAPRETRATVTSVRSLGEGLVAGASFALIAVLSVDEDPTPGLHWVIGLLALVALLVLRWVPSSAATVGGDAQRGAPSARHRPRIG